VFITLTSFQPEKTIFLKFIPGLNVFPQNKSEKTSFFLNIFDLN